MKELWYIYCRDYFKVLERLDGLETKIEDRYTLSFHEMLDTVYHLESQINRWMFHVIEQEPKFKLPAWEPNKLYPTSTQNQK